MSTSTTILVALALVFLMGGILCAVAPNSVVDMIGQRHHPDSSEIEAMLGNTGQTLQDIRDRMAGIPTEMERMMAETWVYDTDPTLVRAIGIGTTVVGFVFLVSVAARARKRSHSG